MEKILNIRTILLMLALLFYTGLATAQTGFEDDVDDEVEPEPEASINNWILAGVAGGAAAGYVLLRKGQKAL